MELQPKLELLYDVDAVLRGQGADAAILRSRRPVLDEIAEQARRASISWLHSKVVYREYIVTGRLHDNLLLDDGRSIKSQLIASSLRAANG